MTGHDFTSNVKFKRAILLSLIIESKYLMLIGQSHGDPPC